MTWYPDLATECQITAGEDVRAVGWLSADHPFQQGEVASEHLEKLRSFGDHWLESAAALGWPVAFGAHKCEFCRKVSGAGNFAVPAGNVLFVAPELIVHYVAAHRYSPPAPFLEAVMAAPLPTAPAYAAAVAGFRAA